jgi:hypothetical protein
MGTSGRIATMLDFMCFDRNRVQIRHYLTSTRRPTPRRGATVAREMRGRFLARYITAAQAVSMTGPTPMNSEVYATPTAYSPEEAPVWLITPGSVGTRPYVVLLDPAVLVWIIGAMLVGPAAGIQYVLPQGYPAEAIVVPGAPTGHWYLPVTSLEVRRSCCLRRFFRRHWLKK